MNRILPIDKRSDFYRKIIYIFVLLICIIAIWVAVYYQYYKNKDVTKIDEDNSKNEQTNEITIEEFNSIFNNKLITDTKYNFQKDYEQYDLVFTRYKSDKNESGKYSISLDIPHINIKEEKIEQYNKKISNIFLEKAKSITKNENSTNVVYTVQYTACIKDNILSLIIKANLKEENNAQRVIIQTYNYDLEKKQELTIGQILNKKGIEDKQANKKIKEEIEKVQNQVTEFEKLGYTIYTRNPEDDMYKIENTKEFYIDNNNNLYIIYAYGNRALTSEMDLVVF